MGTIFALALAAAVNPTLLAVVALMLTLARPKPLLLAYTSGALIVSITCGLLLVYLLPGSQNATTAKHTVRPVIDISVGVLILLIALWVETTQHPRFRTWGEHRREKQERKPPPRWKRTLSNASPWHAFILGMALSLPGAEYLAGMDILHKQDAGVAVTVLVVLAFNVVQFLVIGVPAVGYMVRPQSTDATVKRFTDWLRHRGTRVALIVALVIGILLIVRGTVVLFAR
jgi:Sap, sulfolipid-1-addressing protein